METVKLQQPKFQGRDPDWKQWSFEMRAYITLMFPDGEQLIGGAEPRDRVDISLTRMPEVSGAEGVESAKKMYGTLILLLDSETLIHTVQAVEMGNGAAIWRALRDRCESQAMRRARTLIT